VPPRRREDPRRSPLLPIALVVGGAGFLAAALIALSLVSGSAGEDEPDAASVVAASIPVGRDPLFRGIPQKGIALGSADAPVTLVEYADLQCPYCAQWARDAFPTIVDDYVRPGKVRVVFRGMSFLGPDSEKALRAALAAGRQNRLWDVLHALYANQGGENDGWVTDGLLRSLGRTGLDADRMLSETASGWVEDELTAAARAAEAAGVPGTPFFEAGRTNGELEPLHVRALDGPAFAAELDRLLAE
jgi:protein-disulfide isomerase